MPEQPDGHHEDVARVDQAPVVGNLTERLDISQEAKFAANVAFQAGQILIERFDQIQDRTSKGRTNFKIAVDDELDAFIRSHIEQSYPEDSINSEEVAAKDTGSSRVWLVDPLDGTIPYTLRSSDHSANSIALAEQQIPQLGVINVALKHELFIAEIGKGAFLNGVPTSVGDTTELNQAVVGIDYGKINRIQGLETLQKLLGPDGITYPVSYAGAAASLALVASNRLDGYLSYEIEPWDVAAAAIICSEAGAVVSTIDGRPWTITEPTILVANKDLHQKLLDLIAI